MSSKQSGFTLIELMIATIAGAMAVAGVYYLNGMSSRMFGEQMRVSETQMALRSGLEQLRRDFSRAGYLSTPNSNTLADCDGTLGGAGVAPSVVRSLAITRDGSLESVKTLLRSPDLNKTRADSVVLTGNFATSDAYLTNPTSSSSTTIVFQLDSEAFRRSFFTPTPGNGVATFDTARFISTFTANRMLRVENEGRTFLRQIASSAATSTSASVTLATALPACFDPTRWAAVSPVMSVRYALETDSQSADLKRLRAQTPSFGASRPLLVRREVDTAGNVVADTARVVLDYVVEFSVDPIVWTAGAFSYALGQTERDAANLNPETIAAALVTISSRSQDADPNLPTLDRARIGDAENLSSPLRTFRVVDPASPAVASNARVRTARAEIFLQNH